MSKNSSQIAGLPQGETREALNFQSLSQNSQKFRERERERERERASREV